MILKNLKVLKVFNFFVDLFHSYLSLLSFLFCFFLHVFYHKTIKSLMTAKTGIPFEMKQNTHKIKYL